MDTPAECESCARPGTDLVRVIRVWVTPATWENDNTQKVSEASSPEWWCFSCRTHYPHRPLES